VPEWGPLGSVRGAFSNERPYRDLRNVVAIIALKGRIDLWESSRTSVMKFSCTASAPRPDDVNAGPGLATTHRPRRVMTEAIPSKKQNGLPPRLVHSPTRR
jgi:hypothetical protein